MAMKRWKTKLKLNFARKLLLFMVLMLMNSLKKSMII